MNKEGDILCTLFKSDEEPLWFVMSVHMADKGKSKIVTTGAKNDPIPPLFTCVGSLPKIPVVFRFFRNFVILCEC